MRHVTTEQKRVNGDTFIFPGQSRKNAHTFSFHILSHWLTNADNRKWLHTVIFLVTRINLWCQKTACVTYGFYPWS